MIELIGHKIFLDDNYEIREYETEKGIIRALVLNECTQSLIYVDNSNKNELVIDYFRFYNLLIDLNPKGKNYLMLGGGAISYPHYFFSKYKDKNMDIIEINPKCIEYAKEYFFLEELNENVSERLSIIVDDAINYISKTNKKYDYILIDLFNGRVPIKEIYEDENIINLKKIIADNGIIVINYIIENDMYKAVLNKIIQITNNYKIIADKKYFNEVNANGNIVIILSNNEIKIPEIYDYIDISILVNLIN